MKNYSKQKLEKCNKKENKKNYHSWDFTVYEIHEVFLISREKYLEISHYFNTFMFLWVHTTQRIIFIFVVKWQGK